MASLQPDGRPQVVARRVGHRLLDAQTPRCCPGGKLAKQKTQLVHEASALMSESGQGNVRVASRCVAARGKRVGVPSRRLLVLCELLLPAKKTLQLVGGQ